MKETSFFSFKNNFHNNFHILARQNTNNWQLKALTTAGVDVQSFDSFGSEKSLQPVAPVYQIIAIKTPLARGKVKYTQISVMNAKVRIAIHNGILLLRPKISIKGANTCPTTSKVNQAGPSSARIKLKSSLHTTHDARGLRYDSSRGPEPHCGQVLQNPRNKKTGLKRRFDLTFSGFIFIDLLKKLPKAI